jgi:phenylacetate-CoA ligase
MAMMFSRGQSEFYDEVEIIPTELRERCLNQRLYQAINHAYRNAPAARTILDQAGVSPLQVKTIKDIQKIPITRKTDLIRMQREKPPFGGFLAIPTEDIDRIFISPGPIYEPIQHAGIKWFARSFWAAGFRKGDLVVNTFTYHMSPAGILFHEALRDCGSTVIAMGTGSIEIQIQTMIDLKVTGFVGTPSFLMTIIKKIEEMGSSLHQDFHLKRAWFTGEMLTPSIRRTLEEQYQIETTQAYAVTEPGGAIAYECGRKNGMHFMDDYIIEIVDPGTGKQLEAGEIGEIVVTPVHNKQWGLIRFGTGDMSSYTEEACPCGRTAFRLTGIVGRTSDAIKVRGMFIVAKQMEQVLLRLNAISRFQAVVERKGERDEIKLNIELRDETVNRDELTTSINERFQAYCRLKIDQIEYFSPSNLPDKYQQIVDRRIWD